MTGWIESTREFDKTLKGCPFCDGVSYLERDACDFGIWAVRCPNCQATSAWSETRQDAADRWNRRVPPTEKE